MADLKDNNFLNKEKDFPEVKKLFFDQFDLLFAEYNEAMFLIEGSGQEDVYIARMVSVMSTIKCLSKAVGYMRIAELMSITENYLSQLKTIQATISTNVLKPIIDSVDAVKDVISSLRKNLNLSDKSLNISSSEQAILEMEKKLKIIPDSQDSSCSSSRTVQKDQQSQNEISRSSNVRKDNDIKLVKKPEFTTKEVTQKIKIGLGVKSTVLRIDAAKIEDVLNLAGELIVLKSQVCKEKHSSENPNNVSFGIENLFDRTIRELYEKSVSMRMASLRTLFMKFHRTARLLSKKTGKKVTFKIVGESTELDRHIIEQLSDPLMHIIRNSIDHGIECEEERRKTNKDPCGNILLKAYQRGDKVVIEVSDDGRGIDKDNVIRKAYEKGLINDIVDVDLIPEQRVFDFLFEESFSTAKEVTDISGRGVGLNIVKTNVNEMKGIIEVESEYGLGSLFRVILPLTTAISDGVLVRVMEHSYIIPTEYINEFVELKPNKIVECDGNVSVVEIRDEYIELKCMRGILLSEDRMDTKGILVIVELLGNKIALIVDEVIEQVQIVLKHLDEDLRNEKHISGGAILGDGSVGLVIDVPSIICDNKNLAQKIN